MKKDKHASQHRRNAENYLKQNVSTFIIDPSTGLYQPKAHTPQDQREDHVRSDVDPPFFMLDLTDQSGNAANWTMAIATWMAVLVSFITAVLLIYTAIYTHKQWIEAKRTAKASTDAVQVTRDAVRTTREQGLLDQRPWISLKDPKCDVCKAEYGGVTVAGATATIVNTGKTPAEEVRVEFSVQSGIYYWSSDDCESSNKQINCIPGKSRIQKFQGTKEPHPSVFIGVVPPGQPVPIVFMVDPWQYNSPKDNTGTTEFAYMQGVITYRTPWGVQGETRFCYPLNEIGFMLKPYIQDYCENPGKILMR